MALKVERVVDSSMHVGNALGRTSRFDLIYALFVVPLDESSRRGCFARSRS
jgi:hypothetical protein